MRVTILGTGTSSGIPVIGCNCPVCSSSNPKNKRRRCSVIINQNEQFILIDTSPDFRQQALDYGLHKLNAILYTHDHADHLHGLDDIRPLCWKEPIPVFASKSTLQLISKRFSYIFKPVQKGGGTPHISLNEVKNEEFNAAGVLFQPLHIKHGILDIFGYRCGNFAYITDCSYLPDETINKLQGLQYLVINALRYRKHSTHFNVEEALKIIDRLKPEKAYLTHMAHNLEHENLEKELPENVKPAYDGLSFEIED